MCEKNNGVWGEQKPDPSQIVTAESPTEEKADFFDQMLFQKDKQGQDAQEKPSFWGRETLQKAWQGNKLPAENPLIPCANAFLKRDLLFALVLTVITFLMVRWGLYGQFHLGFALIFPAYLLSCLLYIGKKTEEKKGSYLSLFCLLFPFVSAPVFALWQEGSLHFLLFLEMMACFYLAIGKRSGFLPSFSGSLALVWQMLCVFFLAFTRLFAPFRALFSSPLKKQRGLLYVLLGILASFPVLLLVVPLLISADAAFEGLMQTLFLHLALLLVQGLLCAILLPFLFARQFALRKGAGAYPTMQVNGFMPSVFANAFLSAVNLCYLLYLFSQLAYFFSAFAGLLPTDFVMENGVFPVAAYARRGFFEMFAVSVINFMVLMLLLLFVKKKDGALQKGFACLAQFLCLFTLLLIAAALSKMGLYITSFGFTRLRLLTCVCMMMLGIVFICLSVRLWARRFPYMKCILVSVCLLTLLVAYGNVDRMVARANIRAYQSGQMEDLDVAYLYRLNDAAKMEMEVLYEDEKVGPFVRAAYTQAYYENEWSLERDALRKRHFSKETLSHARFRKVLLTHEKDFLIYKPLFSVSHSLGADGLFYCETEDADWLPVPELSLKEAAREEER